MVGRAGTELEGSRTFHSTDVLVSPALARGEQTQANAIRRELPVSSLDDNRSAFSLHPFQLQPFLLL